MQNDALTKAQEFAGKLEGLVVRVTQKAGVDGRLFGSVTNHDISDALKALGYEVSKTAVRFPSGPLKQVGDHDILLDLHADAKANIKVSVFREA